MQTWSDFNPIQGGSFRGCSGTEMAKKHTSYNDETWHSYTLPKKDKKMHKSLNTLFELCWHQYFFTGYQQLLSYYEMQI